MTTIFESPREATTVLVANFDIIRNILDMSTKTFISIVVEALESDHWKAPPCHGAHPKPTFTPVASSSPWALTGRSPRP
jgi:hypothetical protein